MKRFIYILFFSLLLSFLSISELTANDTIRLATYNVRVATGSDTGNRAWAMRKEHVADIIKNVGDFDIFGVNELTNQTQQNELMAYLSNKYNIFAKATGNNSGTSGARNAIIFKKDRFTVTGSGFFFLNEDPLVADPGWDAKLTRNCLWLKVRDNNTTGEFYFFASHFDHVGAEARRQSASLVINKIKEINVEKLPVVFVGDLNIQPDKIPIATLKNGGLTDSRTVPAPDDVVGPVGTTNGWNRPVSELFNRIDYVFVTPEIDVKWYITIPKKYYPDAYPSDHFPVMIKAIIPSDVIEPPATYKSKLHIEEFFSTQAWEDEIKLRNPGYETPTTKDSFPIKTDFYFDKFELFNGSIQIEDKPTSGACQEVGVYHKHDDVAVGFRLNYPEDVNGVSWITLPRIPNAGKIILHVKGNSPVQSKLSVFKYTKGAGADSLVVFPMSSNDYSWNISRADNTKYTMQVDEIKERFINSRDSITLRIGSNSTDMKILGIVVEEHNSVPLKHVLDSALAIYNDNKDKIGPDLGQYPQEAYDAFGTVIQDATDVYEKLASYQGIMGTRIMELYAAITAFYESINDGTGYKYQTIINFSQNGRSFSMSEATDIEIFNSIGVKLFERENVMQFEIPPIFENGIFIIKTKKDSRKIILTK